MKVVLAITGLLSLLAGPASAASVGNLSPTGDYNHFTAWYVGDTTWAELQNGADYHTYSSAIRFIAPSDAGVIESISVAVDGTSGFASLSFSDLTANQGVVQNFIDMGTVGIFTFGPSSPIHSFAMGFNPDYGSLIAGHEYQISLSPAVPYTSWGWFQNSTGANGFWASVDGGGYGYINAVAPAWAVNYVAASVPEPEQLAMLLSGLGLIGLMVRRRTA